MKFVVFSRTHLFKRRQWYFRIIAKNGETVAQSEGYFNYADCLDTIASIRLRARTAKLEIEA